jgi:hypothetical protein
MYTDQVPVHGTGSVPVHVDRKDGLETDLEAALITKNGQDIRTEEEALQLYSRA